MTLVKAAQDLGVAISLGLRRRLRRRMHVPDLRPCRTAVELTAAYGPGGTRPDVLVLGDSVSIRVSRDDNDRTDLGRMIARHLPAGVRTCVIAEDGYHAGVFTALVRVLATLPHQPKVLIGTINLRSCSPQWALNPLWQYEEVIGALERYAADPHAGVPKVAERAPTTEQRDAYLAAPACHPGRDEATVGDFVSAIARSPTGEDERMERLRTIFSFHYGFALEDTNRRLADLRELARLMASLPTRVLLYVTPVNHEGGIRLLGPAFSDTIADHVQTVLGACRPGPASTDGIRVADWSTLLRSDSFFHSYEPSEHLNQDGRRLLAEHVARRCVADGLL